MPKRALTREERRFAAENHRLILAFLARRGLPEEDYYAVAALGYLEAVQRYLSQPDLRRHAFSTVANQAMRRGVSHAKRMSNRRCCPAETVSLDTGGMDGAPLYHLCGGSMDRRLEEVLLLHALSARLPAQQYELIWLRLAGYSVREIAARKKMSEKKVRSLLRRARRAFGELCGPAYAEQKRRH